MNFEAAANSCVDFWSNQLENPKYDNGDLSSNGAIIAALAHLGKSQIEDIKIKKFKFALKTFITEYRDFRFSNDYDPCSKLSAICKYSDIENPKFSWKTETFTGESVEGKFVLYGKLGYAAEPKIIYSE